MCLFRLFVLLYRAVRSINPNTQAMRTVWSGISTVAFLSGQYGAKPGPRLNIKTVLSTYGDFHVKDKTAVRTSYL